MSNGRDNLIVPSSKQARENGRKGGIASGEARKRMKTFKDMAKIILALPLSEKEQKVLVKAGLSGTDMPTDKKGLLLFAVAQKAIGRGDSQAMMRLAELTGEHIDEKKIQLEGDSGQRTIINLIPKGGFSITIKPEYIRGMAMGSDSE